MVELVLVVVSEWASEGDTDDQQLVSATLSFA